MKSLQLLAAIGLITTSTHAIAFVSIVPTTVHCSRYPSTSVSLHHINCNKRKGYPTRSCRNVDFRSRSSTSLSAIPNLSTVTTSLAGFYKTYPLLAGIIVGLFSRLTQHSSRKDTKLLTLSLNNKHRNNSNFAIRAICSGLVLGILFEIVIHGSIILSILFGSTANIANGSINGMSIARATM